MTAPGYAERSAGRSPRVIPGLWLLVLISGVAVVYVSHQCRLLYGQLAALEQQKNQLEVEWGQYLLEESTLASLQRIEQLATQELDMQVPVLDDVVVVRP